MTIAMQPIYTQTVSGTSTSEVRFNNIPATFTDIKVEISARTSQAATIATGVLFLNLDTSLGSFTNLAGDGSSAFSTRASGYIDGCYFPAANATASTFGSVSFYIPNYAGASFKQVIVDGATENNATLAYTNLRAILWRSTNAITQFGINAGAGGTFAANTTFTLYGLTKG